MQRKKMLLFPFICISVLLLAACGAQQGHASSPGSDTPTAATPTSVTKQGTLASSKVIVIVGKARYTPNEVITVTINNGMTTSISAANHQSGCTMITLQWQDAQGTWQNQNRCRQGAMTRMITLPSRSSQVQSLSPTAGTFARSAEWARGNYRIVFSFTLDNADVESIPMTGVPGSPIYSSAFVVA